MCDECVKRQSVLSSWLSFPLNYYSLSFLNSLFFFHYIPLNITSLSLSLSLCLSHFRFWKLDDDGVYLITLNIAKHSDFPSSVATSGKGSKASLRKAGSALESSDQPLPTANNKNQSSSNLPTPKSLEKPFPTPVPPKKGSEEYSPPSVDAVITISPRRGETFFLIL